MKKYLLNIVVSLILGILIVGCGSGNGELYSGTGFDSPSNDKHASLRGPTSVGLPPDGGVGIANEP